MMRRCMIVVAGMFLFVFMFFGRTVFVSMAEEESRYMPRYYKSIQIQEGDSLWGIAQEYCEDGQMSPQEYVEELKFVNQLHQDTIHAGQYLTVIYFQPSGPSIQSPYPENLS